jgi:hypothetical protein
MFALIDTTNLKFLKWTGVNSANVIEYAKTYSQIDKYSTLEAAKIRLNFIHSLTFKGYQLEVVQLAVYGFTD